MVNVFPYIIKKNEIDLFNEFTCKGHRTLTQIEKGTYIRFTVIS